MSIEKFNFVKDGAIRLPPGFRFQPTDEELVFQYLKRKVLSCPLPASIIPEINVCRYDPWDLPGEMEQERYFFSSKEVKYMNGNRANRATASGYWRATGSDKKIGPLSRNYHIAIGMKKTLVFYTGKPQNGSRTNWVMHEYRLRANNSIKDCSMIQMDSWVICRVFLKKSLKNHEHIVKSSHIPASPSSSSCSSSSCCSDITEVSSSGADNEEQNQCYDLLP